MGKPRIFIAMHYLEIGGAETALIGLLQTLDPAKVDVDLFLYAHRGEMLRYVPDWVNLLPEDKTYSLIEAPMTQALKAGKLRLVAMRLHAKLMHKRYLRKKGITDESAIFGYVGHYVTKALPSLKRYGRYDLAISFLTPHNMVLDKVDAQKKICWIHTDYSYIDVDTDMELPVWGAYDHIMSISPDVTEAFCSKFPTLRSKIVEMENIISPAFIQSRADEVETPQDISPDSGVIKLLTIGRYSYQKKLEEIPAICRLLVENGINAQWYIIGYGSDDGYIRREIEREGMQVHVHILGKRENPYPYIKACDWYVQPSRYEGKSITVREAQILRKPVIITAYPTAPSQVKDWTDGVIVPLDIPACAQAMVNAIKDDALKKRLITHLTTHDYGNTAEAEKIYDILGIFPVQPQA